MTTKRDDEEMSMEDILASIRRYVADEASEQIDKPSSAMVAEAFSQERKSYPPVGQGTSSLDASTAEVIYLTEKNEAPLPSFSGIPETLVSEKVQTASPSEKVQGAFSRLAEAAARSQTPSFKATSSSSAASGLTLDHLISELARPMIKQWLDDNLGALVESLVNKEIERITCQYNTR